MKTTMKDMRELREWGYADIVALRDRNGKKIEITSDSKRRDLNNKEILNWEIETRKGLNILTVVLDYVEENGREG